LSQFLSKFTGFPWPQSEAPFHLYEFTESTLVRLLSDSGFKILSKIYYGGSSLPYIIGSTSYFDTLKQKLKSEGTYHLNWSIVQNLPMLCAITFLLTPLFIAGKISDRILNKGAKLRILAIKP